MAVAVLGEPRLRPLRGVTPQIVPLVEGEGVRQTKLLQPRLAADAVDRPRLLALLDGGLDATLVLLSGPGGYGKTTLLQQWLATQPWPAAWLTLDDRDNVASFVAHVVAALRPHVSGARWGTLGLLQLAGAAAPADLGAALAEDVAAATGDAVLVLDDYQEVVDSGVHEVLEALLRHPPPHLHLVVATRVDPPLPLARLRARGQLVELRAADLRFTADEAGSFFARTLPVGPAPEAVEMLAARTEGWAAGLRLASIALQRQTPSAAVVSSFAGGRQTLALDYLLDEVFERQPPALQDFLLRTAVVDRLCVPLCDTLLAAWQVRPGETPGWAGGMEVTGEALLSSAVSANLFLTPLDESAVGAGGGFLWYRYHPLFRDLLLDQLRVRRGPAAERALHACAGAWFAGAGMVEEGIMHALAAGDPGAAAALVERNALPMIDDDEWLALERWLGLLPPEVVRHGPTLLVTRACLAQRRGQLDALPALLAAATAAVAGLPAGGDSPEGPVGRGEPSGPDRATLEGVIASLAITRDRVAGDAQGMLASADRVLQLLPEAYPYLRGAAVGTAALAALAVDGEAAASRWIEALPAIASGSATVTAMALPATGFALFLAGRHHEVVRAGHTLLQLSERQGQTVLRNWGHVLLGAVQYEWNQLDEAIQHLTAVLEVRDRVRLMPLRSGTFGLALALQAQGRAGEADEVLDQFADVLLRTANASQLAWVGAFRVRLALLRGDLAPARRWLPSSDRLLARWLDEVMDAPLLTRAWARLCLASEAPSPGAAFRDALAEIEGLLATTERLHLVTRQAQALALRALAHDALGQPDPATDSLARALDLGEPGGMVRTFVDLGAPLAGVLRRLVPQRPRSAYCRQLLTACETAVPRSLVAAPPALSKLAGQLVEPLTSRELEVLDRLRRQWLNKEIADDLHVSPETVKTHVAHLCAKLGVSDRRRAVRRAAELGLLTLD